MQDDRIRNEFPSRTIACENECGYWLAAAGSAFVFPDCPYCAVPMVEVPEYVRAPEPMFKCRGRGCGQWIASCEECQGPPRCHCLRQLCGTCAAKEHASAIAWHEKKIVKLLAGVERRGTPMAPVTRRVIARHQRVIDDSRREFEEAGLTF